MMKDLDHNIPMIIPHTLKSKRISLAILFVLIMISLWSVFSIPNHKTLITICPVKNLTGYSCPGCGLSRSIVFAAHGDFSHAFYYHPLWIIVLPLMIAFGSYHLVSLIINKRLNTDHLLVRKFKLGQLLLLLALLFIIIWFGILGIALLH